MLRPVDTMLPEKKYCAFTDKLLDHFSLSGLFFPSLSTRLCTERSVAGLFECIHLQLVISRLCISTEKQSRAVSFHEGLRTL